MPANDSRSLVRSTKAAVVHKVIDITPEPDAPKRKVVLEEALAYAQQHRNACLAGAAALLALVVGLLSLGHGSHTTAAAAPAPKPQPAVPAPQQLVLRELNLPTAVQQGLVNCQWRGNGRDRLFLDATNTSAQPLRLHLSAGQLLASVDSTIAVLESQTLDFAPHEVLHEQFDTVATSSANKVVGAEYHLSAGALPDLGNLFAYAAAHQQARPAAIQTATLILTENLPLSAFAKFKELGEAPADAQESPEFKADTVDILSALSIVKAIGIERPLAITIDPQLEVEAMIDPDAHDMALRYYDIQDEWAFWKNQLLQGDPSTRHYALYGIARYYPDVALQMLPKWARGQDVGPVFRLSAVQALAQTGKAEAIPILRELEREFGGTSDLGRTAHQSANFLDAQFAHGGPEPVGDSPGGRRAPALASAGN
jgi:hypothetical protein